MELTREIGAKMGMRVIGFDSSHAGLVEARHMLDQMNGFEDITGLPLLSRRGDTGDVLFRAYQEWLANSHRVYCVIGIDGKPDAMCKLNGQHGDFGMTCYHDERANGCIIPDFPFGFEEYVLFKRKYDWILPEIGRYIEGEGMYEGRTDFVPTSMSDRLYGYEWNDGKGLDGLSEGERYVVAVCTADGSEEVLGRLSKDSSWRVRRGVAFNCSADSRILDMLSEDPDWRVRQAVCAVEDYNCGTCGRPEAMARLASDPEYEVRIAAAAGICRNALFGKRYGKMLSRVLDSPYDDDFKADVSEGMMASEYDFIGTADGAFGNFGFAAAGN